MIQLWKSRVLFFSGNGETRLWRGWVAANTKKEARSLAKEAAECDGDAVVSVLPWGQYRTEELSVMGVTQRLV